MTPLINPPRSLTFSDALRRLGWWERLFGVSIGCLLAVGFFGLGEPWFALSLILFLVTAPLAIWRIGRLLLKTLIWRLRNRLIVAYVFIALVPLLLLGALASLVTFVVTGQMAIYLVMSELERQVGTLRGGAESVLRVPPERRLAAVERLGAYFEEKFPNFEIRVDQGDTYLYPEDASIQPTPKAWKDTAGILRKQDEYFVWAHVHSPDGEVTAMAPLTSAYLSNLVPRLGPVALIDMPDNAGNSPSGNRRRKLGGTRQPRVTIPEPINALDLALTYPTFMPISIWGDPGANGQVLLRVETRLFAVLKIIFTRNADWDQNLGLGILLFVSLLFVGFELVALVIGVTLTRTITNTVHDIYEGTNRVMEGDFSHRIVLKGRDQLAQLGDSFNRMTENLERLLKVAKENERLNAELEIAREVQRQLYPKSVPDSRHISITAHYQPARMVSGDYFDFHRLGEDEICMTIGDVAGKGISAALLMATVQSSFRSRIQRTDGPVCPAKLVTDLNIQLFHNTAPEKFSTFFLGIFNETTAMLRYTNAGHLPPILIRNGQASLLNVDGMVVGAFPFAQYGETSLRLDPGDLLLFYTDGISEPQNEYGEMYGEERLIEIVKRNANRSDAQIIKSVMTAVSDWTGSPELQDDMTILILRRN